MLQWRKAKDSNKGKVFKGTNTLRQSGIDVASRAEDCSSLAFAMSKHTAAPNTAMYQQSPPVDPPVQGCVRVAVSGSPIPQPRPRIGRKWLQKRMIAFLYDPAKAQKVVFRSALMDALGSRAVPLYPRGDPVAINVDFQMKRPAYHFNDGGILKLDCQFDEWPRVSDLDNLVKFVFDAGKGVLFADDAQVVSLQTSKFYHPYDVIPCTTITIYPARRRDAPMNPPH
jgi:Holliday junction resolvase RusA-like endonuclease